jgi:hypothetical protein
VNNLKVRGENTDRNTNVTTYIDKSIANSNLNNIVILQSDDYLMITVLTFFSPEILESDSRAMLEKERQLHPSVQGDSIISLPGKRSRSLSGSNRADSCGSD